MSNNNEKYEFGTPKGVFKLNILDVIEPNNGRMLNKVALFFNEEDITKKYFGDWNYTNIHLNEYEALSADKIWLYIPQEGEHFLINTQNFEKISLPSLTLSAATFMGNYFIGNYLIIWGLEEIIQKNLLTKTTKILKQIEKNLYFRILHIEDEQKITVTFNNGQTKSFDFTNLKKMEE